VRRDLKLVVIMLCIGGVLGLGAILLDVLTSDVGGISGPTQTRYIAATAVMGLLYLTALVGSLLATRRPSLLFPFTRAVSIAALALMGLLWLIAREEPVRARGLQGSPQGLGRDVGAVVGPLEADE